MPYNKSGLMKALIGVRRKALMAERYARNSGVDEFILPAIYMRVEAEYLIKTLDPKLDLVKLDDKDEKLEDERQERMSRGRAMVKRAGI